jgi:predicted permease
MDDIRNALRQWKRNPGITALALFSLALGIGGSLALFHLVDALVLRKLPVRDADRLVRIVGREFRPGEQHDIAFSSATWEYFRQHQQIFEQALAVGRAQVNLARGGEAQFVSATFVDSAYFGMLGIAAQRGRTLSSSDEADGAQPVAVISDALWRSRYGARDEALGQSIYLDDQPFTIVGVAPREFTGLEIGRPDDVIVPMCAQDVLYGVNSNRHQPASAWLQIYAHLPAGMAISNAAAALAAWYPALRTATLPAGVPEERHMAYPLDLADGSRGQSFLRRRFARPLTLLLGAVGAVLLIACINLAVLSLGRLLDRQHEIGIRMSLGATKGRVIRLLLTDSLLLSAVSGLFGLWGGVWLARAVAPYLTIPRVAAGANLPLGLDLRLAGVVVLLVLVCGTLAGLLAAWRASRVHPMTSLAAGGRGASSHGRAIALMRALAGSQVALSLVLVIGASLLVRSFVTLTTRPTGLDAANVLVVAVSGNLDAPSPPERLERIGSVREALSRVPGVEAVSAGAITPLSGAMAAARLEIPGSESPTPAGAATPFNRVLPGFFDVIGTSVLRGRDFNESDTAGAAPVAIVNRAFAERHWGGRNPIGRVLVSGTRQLEVIGVVENSRQFSLSEPNQVPMAYGPIAQWATSRIPNLRFTLRTEQPDMVRTGAAAALRGVDPSLSIEFRTMQDEAEASIHRERMLAWIGGLFAALGLLLAILGLYGTFAYAVVRRRMEIGIRLALGAQPSNVMRHLLRDAGLVVAGGLVVGLAAARAGAQWIQSLLFGLSASDLETTTLACAAILMAAAIATYIPARRAASVDPVATLRE